MQPKHKISTSLYPDWPTKPEFHWFLTSACNWVSDPHLFRGLKRIQKADRSGLLVPTGCSVYKVPGKWNTSYEINNYAPDTEGVEYITYVKYKPEKLK